MDDNGFPKHLVSEVAVGSVEEQMIKTQHNILASGNTLAGQHFVNACDEVPSDEICNTCFSNKNCNFSQDRRRWR